MISYFFQKNANNHIIIAEVSGHALYAPKGFDIVCASVSTAIIVTLNALEMLGFQKNITYILKDNFFHLEVQTFKENNMFLLLKNLKYSLDNLSTQYPSHFKKLSSISQTPNRKEIQ